MQHLAEIGLMTSHTLSLKFVSIVVFGRAIAGLLAKIYERNLVECIFVQKGKIKDLEPNLYFLVQSQQ